MEPEIIERGIVVALWALAMVSAFAYLWLTETPTCTQRTAVKATPLLAFAAIAAIAHAPVMVIVALALSAVGDIALSRDGSRAFLTGLIAFALAHLAYLALFVPHVSRFERAPIFGMVIVAALAIAIVVPSRDPLTWPARAYAVIICAMTAAALSLPFGLRGATVGAVLFLMSDLILAVRLFHLTEGTVRARMAGYTLWVLYVSGQGLILLAFL
ncbi:MAG: lysoplasmalogenase family protein [Celeribacter marinus]